MCGIAAVLGAGPRAEALADRLVHRGPDGRGALVLDGCSLAMTRLAILDPTPRAGQPMSFAGRHLVFNGEIYNFRAVRSVLEAAGLAFTTTGDTEVLLKALVHWGPGGLERMRGMFAFLLWDEGTQTLLAGRDPIGVKPLYWRRLSSGAIAFASEAAPLAGLERAAVRPQAVAEFLRFGSPVETTIYEGVHEHPPGTVTLWRPDGAVVREPIPLAHEERPLPEVMRRAIAENTVSDRPVAVFLSGGFDSAAIAAGLSAEGISATGLTISTDANASDVARARETAAHYGLDHRVVHVAGADATGAVDRFLAAMDQPTIDGLNTLLVSEVASSVGFPVALSGLGGDEVLGGYGYHRRWRLLGTAARVWRASPPSVRGSIERALAGRGLRTDTQVRELLAASGTAARYDGWRSLFTADEVVRLTGSRSALPDPVDIPPGEPLRDQLWRLDARRYLGPTLLRDADVFSMTVGVEVRVPLLDTSVVDAALGSPPQGKAGLARQWEDPYLKRLAAGRKLTFALPWRAWIGATLRANRQALEVDDPWHGSIDPAEAHRHIDRAASGPGAALRCWALLVLAEWLRCRSAAPHPKGRPA
ncbi:MAG: asparagine synthase (glutamine-hydrolyzing) [Acidimicrobiales bacterium]|nr:asparagine synthase (glutamine-hydrolyzing) [Acidimicrobiales bacterium]